MTIRLTLLAAAAAAALLSVPDRARPAPAPQAP